MTTNRVTYFILRANTGVGGKSRERLWKDEGEWTWKVEVRTRNKYLAAGEACVVIF